MDQKFYQKCLYDWLGTKSKMEKMVPRYGCCGLMKSCRRWEQSLDYSPGRASVHERVQLLAELLADAGSARDVPIACRCQEPSLKDSYSLAMVLSPVFRVLSGHYEDEFRLGGTLKSLFQLLHNLFLPLDVMCCWRTMTTADPFLQDLLEVCRTLLVPRPQEICLSCREHRAVRSEVSAGKRHKSSHRQVGRKSEERRHTVDLFECLHNPDQTCDKSFSWKEEQSPQRQKPGQLSSIQKLKNSLKKDLETHRLYLRTIETRLSGLERRAQDVTKKLEKANLELEAIKQGSVTLKTLMDEQISSPVTEDLEDLEQHLWDQWQWRRVAGRSVHPESCKRKDFSHGCANDYATSGSHVHQRSELQTGLSTCKHHVDVLLQQVTQQINQMESDIKLTSKLYQSAG